MTTTEQPPAIDMEKLMGFVFRAVGDIGATVNTALVVMGDRLGLYRALAGAGALTPAELAQRTGTAERYVCEWLNAQAAGAYVDYDPDSARYSLPAEHAVALADESCPAYLPGFFQGALGAMIDSPRITEAAKPGEAIGWHEYGQDVFDGVERFHRTSYNAHLVSEWLPALDGVVAKLERGAAVADAVGRPGHTEGPAVEDALGYFPCFLPYLVGKRAAVPEGAKVVFRIGARPPVAVEVEGGRGRLAADPGDATADLAIPLTTFAALVGGRCDVPVTPSFLVISGSAGAC